MERRPDADELLARVEEEERRARRGKLTIFFGAAPGVGKTYAMLEAARSERDLRRDVVVGFVEAHGRYETAALTIGLEMLPRRKLEHRGVKLEELDLDAVLARRPGLVLIDEIAHTNAPGSRHVKRWQDVEEVLEAGIDVYTTLNVQHIESLNDVVAQVTGVIVRETVPDRIVDHADEIRLVDLTPEELLERLAEGKVYVPDQALVALSNFFRKGNLIALRELALRQTADRVDRQLRTTMRAEGVEHAWPIGERILVCISTAPDAGRLVRAGRRMASSLRAEWITVWVETPRSARLSSKERTRVMQNLRLAESLGAEIVRLSGTNPADEVIHFARSRNVTKIVVGKPRGSRYREILRPSFLDTIVRDTPDIDVYVITQEEPKHEAPEGARDRGQGVLETKARGWEELLVAFLAVVVTTVVSLLLFERGQLADVVMVYVFGLVLVSMRFGRKTSAVAAFLAIASLDYFFVAPYGTFAVSDSRHFVTFIGLLVVSLVTCHLSQKSRGQAEAVRRREARTAHLYAMNRELAGAGTTDAVLDIAVRHLAETFDVDVCVLLPSSPPGAKPALAVATSGRRTFEPDRNDRGVPEWVWTKGKTAGLGTDTLPSASARFFVLRGARGNAGILGVRPHGDTGPSDPEHEHLLETFTDEVASALERVRLAEEARRMDVEIEAERLRTALLSAISDDLRTPLGAISGATKELLEQDAALDVTKRRALLETTSDEAGRLDHLVQNLLDMTKIAAGAIRPRREPTSLAEIIERARRHLRHLDRAFGARRVDVHLAADLPDVPVDPFLIEQVFVQILENAVRFAPESSAIEIAAVRKPGAVEVSISDRGPGVPQASKERVFEKFYRTPRDEPVGGAGLGLAICRGIIDAHRGRIWVEDREGGGARFCFVLPTEIPAEPAREISRVMESERKSAEAAEPGGPREHRSPSVVESRSDADFSCLPDDPRNARSPSGSPRGRRNV